MYKNSYQIFFKQNKEQIRQQQRIYEKNKYNLIKDKLKEIRKNVFII